MPYLTSASSNFFQVSGFLRAIWMMYLVALMSMHAAVNPAVNVLSSVFLLSLFFSVGVTLFIASISSDLTRKYDANISLRRSSSSGR